MIDRNTEINPAIIGDRMSEQRLMVAYLVFGSKEAALGIAEGQSKDRFAGFSGDAAMQRRKMEN